MADHRQSLANVPSGIQSGIQEEIKSKLEELLQGLLKVKGVNEAIAAVESGDGSFLWSGFVGNEGEGKNKFGAASPFFTASITKLLV